MIISSPVGSTLINLLFLTTRYDKPNASLSLIAFSLARFCILFSSSRVNSFIKSIFILRYELFIKTVNHCFLFSYQIISNLPIPLILFLILHSHPSLLSRQSFYILTIITSVNLSRYSRDKLCNSKNHLRLQNRSPKLSKLQHSSFLILHYTLYTHHFPLLYTHHFSLIILHSKFSYAPSWPLAKLVHWTNFLRSAPYLKILLSKGNFSIFLIETRLKSE